MKKFQDSLKQVKKYQQSKRKGVDIVNKLGLGTANEVQVESSIPRTFELKNTIDPQNHGAGLQKVLWGKSIGKIMCLDSMDTKISMYDEKLVLQKHSLDIP